MATATPTREEIENKVVETTRELAGEPELVTLEATFEECDIDSLDLVELAQIIQEEYGLDLQAEDVKDVKTVRQAVDVVAERLTVT